MPRSAPILDVLEPVKIDEDGSLMWSVQIDLPETIRLELQGYADAEGHGAITLIIHAALYLYRCRFVSDDQRLAGLRAEIEEGMQSGDAGEMTPAAWSEIKRRGQQRFKEVKAAQAAGRIGNLLLPPLLHQFIAERVAASDAASPTDVICAALPDLRHDIARHSSRGMP